MNTIICKSPAEAVEAAAPYYAPDELHRGIPLDRYFLMISPESRQLTLTLVQGNQEKKAIHLQPMDLERVAIEGTLERFLVSSARYELILQERERLIVELRKDAGMTREQMLPNEHLIAFVEDCLLLPREERFQQPELSA